MKKGVFLIFLFVSQTLFSQDTLSFNVFDIKKEPIAYASVVFNDSIGTSSFGNGQVKFIIKAEYVGVFDTVKISCIGYKDTAVLINSIALNDTIFLKENLWSLDEVTVNPNSKYRKRKIGNRRLTVTSCTTNYKYGDLMEEAFRIRNIDKKSQILSINFKIKEIIDSARVDVFILSSDKKTHLPKKRIIRDKISTTITKKGKVSIDVSDMDIFIKKSKDFFLVLRPQVLTRTGKISFAGFDSMNRKWRQMVFFRNWASLDSYWIEKRYADSYMVTKIFTEVEYKK